MASLSEERAMGSGAVDSSQWLSVKEETIFLHDGLIRVTDLAELPSEIGVSEQGDTEQEVGDTSHTQKALFMTYERRIIFMFSFCFVLCKNVFSLSAATHP